ncbi:flagellar basal body P-ring formation chaperone FlgA [Aestuariibius insulae]|uniref:flagellar basal body P-ring formation chaperone FlgA n=1 Tax=Aestuariibius insulae TaxID=2058287 RepID=UPI00345E14C6
MIRVLIFLALTTPAFAETVVATRTIRATDVITASDVELLTVTTADAADHVDLVIGMEARVALYAGRPIRPADVGPPAIVDRNDLVPLVFQSGALTITTEGRSLGRGGVGDVIRVMNLSSRTTVTAKLSQKGIAYVSP